MSSGGWVIDAVAAETVYGSGWKKVWNGLLNAELVPLSKYSGDGLMQTQLVAEATHLPRASAGKNSGKGMASLFATAALEQLSPAPGNLIFLATNHGDTDSIVPLAKSKRDTHLSVQKIESGMTSGLSGMLLREAGNGCIVQSACASGLIALMLGALQARRESKSVAVVAADALSDIECIGFSVAKAVSAERCRPFHRGSDGLTIGEGAAGLKCSWRAASELQQDTPAILGFGLSCDAYHTTSPEPDGKAIERAWRSAMKMAGVAPEDIGAIVVHGTGTESNDSVESVVYRRIWGDKQGPAACSIKGFVGHTMGAAGLLNVLVANEALRTGLLPPTLTDGDERDILLPVGVGGAIEFDRNLKCLAVASGFGGQNAAIVLGRMLL